MFEFRITICDSVNCDYDENLELSIGGCDVLAYKTVSILRDGDIVKCVVPCLKDKKTNTVGTQCKSMIKFSSRGTQCESDIEPLKSRSETLKQEPLPVSSKRKLKKRTRTVKVKDEPVAKSSCGYRTTGSCELVSAGPPIVNQKSAKKLTFAKQSRQERPRHDSSSTMESSDSDSN